MIHTFTGSNYSVIPISFITHHKGNKEGVLSAEDQFHLKSSDTSFSLLCCLFVVFDIDCFTLSSTVHPLFLVGTTNNGIVVFWSTSSATLPIRIFSNHFWLCEPMTMQSAFISSDVCKIICAASPSF